MLPTVDIARDVKGLKLAILDLLEEGFSLSRVTKSLAGATEDVRERAVSATVNARKMTPGYYKLGEYLLWLDQHVRAGVPLTTETLSAFEADGLCAMEAARAEFEHAHPACGSCGTRQDNRFAFQCHECGAEFKTR